MKKELTAICQSPQTEAGWLNTLSLLEFIGARKISKTVCDSHPCLEILEHFADETRHAYAFKKLACDVSGEESDSYLCRDEAVSYFQMLDASLSDWIHSKRGKDDPYANYLLVTYLIEKRAMKLYPLYMNVTTRPEVANALKAIVVEESNHLKDIEKKARRAFPDEAEGDFATCREIEESLFNLLWYAIGKNVERLPAQSALTAS